MSGISNMPVNGHTLSTNYGEIGGLRCSRCGWIFAAIGLADRRSCIPAEPAAPVEPREDAERKRWALRLIDAYAAARRTSDAAASTAAYEETHGALEIAHYALLNALLRAPVAAPAGEVLAWTHERPDWPGWYWWRNQVDGWDPEPVDVDEGPEGDLLVKDGRWAFDELSSAVEWAPLVAPGEAQPLGVIRPAPSEPEAERPSPAALRAKVEARYERAVEYRQMDNAGALSWVLEQIDSLAGES